MERVIKFRGKRLDTGQWVYGDLLTNTTPFEILAYKGQYSVNQDTVGQYVNIIDINGREIYEGDIVCAKADEVAIPENYLIFWDEESAELIAKSQQVWHSQSVCNIMDIEVIGNIYDNPELFEL
jgi:uncharacterized phage protein (TIGR01671 family)